MNIPMVDDFVNLRIQMITIRTSYRCNKQHTREQGSSWIICDQIKWFTQTGITDSVAIPNHPGDCTGTT